MEACGRALRLVSAGDVAAIVERGREEMQPTAARLREQHDLVCALARMTDALLPARFGSFMRVPELRRTLIAHRDEIAKSLATVRGRRQMTVRVLGDGVAARGGLSGVREHTNTGERRPMTARTGTEYLNARRAGAAEPPEVELIRRAVGRRAAAERVEPGARGVRVTVFHLVPTRMVPGYRRAILDLVEPLAPLQLSVTGPWPPFAFTPALL